MRFNPDRFKTRLLNSVILTTLLSVSGYVSATEESQPLNDAPKNWQVQVEVMPLSDDQSADVINLVPKQSIQMKAYVWYPSTQTWLVNYPDWDMPGASIEKMTTPVANLDRELDGFLQYGHTQNYMLTPVDIGLLQLSQKTIDVSPSQDGSAIIPIDKSIQLNVELPDGVYSIERFLPAYSLQVAQEFYLYTNTAEPQLLAIADVEALTLNQGDMLERRITINAKGVKGSSIPATAEIGERADVQQESRYEDVKGIFGFEGGKRVDSIFYSPGQGGRIVVQELEIEWWHLTEKKLNTINIPGASFDSVKVEAYEETIALSWWEKHRSEIFSWGFIAIVVIVVAVTGYLASKSLFQRIYEALDKAVHRFLDSEALLFAKLVTAILFGNNNKAKQLFSLWRFRRRLETVPLALSDYFFSSYQTEPQKPPVSRWQAVRLCYQLRNESKEKRDHKDKYGLPEL